MGPSSTAPEPSDLPQTARTRTKRKAPTENSPPERTEKTRRMGPPLGGTIECPPSQDAPSAGGIDCASHSQRAQNPRRRYSVAKSDPGTQVIWRKPEFNPATGSGDTVEGRSQPHPAPPQPQSIKGKEKYAANPDRWATTWTSMNRSGPTAPPGLLPPRKDTSTPFFTNKVEPFLRSEYGHGPHPPHPYQLLLPQRRRRRPSARRPAQSRIAQPPHCADQLEQQPPAGVRMLDLRACAREAARGRHAVRRPRPPAELAPPLRRRGRGWGARAWEDVDVPERAPVRPRGAPARGVVWPWGAPARGGLVRAVLRVEPFLTPVRQGFCLLPLVSTFSGCPPALVVRMNVWRSVLRSNLDPPAIVAYADHACVRSAHRHARPRPVQDSSCLGPAPGLISAPNVPALANLAEGNCARDKRSSPRKCEAMERSGGYQGGGHVGIAWI